MQRSSRRGRRRGRGRPPTGKERLQLKITPELAAALRLHAENTNRSMSAITEMALLRYLKHPSPKKSGIFLRRPELAVPTQSTNRRRMPGLARVVESL